MWTTLKRLNESKDNSTQRFLLVRSKLDFCIDEEEGNLFVAFSGNLIGL